MLSYRVDEVGDKSQTIINRRNEIVITGYSCCGTGDHESLMRYLYHDVGLAVNKHM